MIDGGTEMLLESEFSFSGESKLMSSESNLSGGINPDELDPEGVCPFVEPEPLCDPCLCKPSMWSGSGEGIRAIGPTSAVTCAAGSESARSRPVKEGAGRCNLSCGLQSARAVCEKPKHTVRATKKR